MFNEMSIKEAAAFVQMPETSFRRICREGQGPTGRKDGRTMRFIPDTLNAWKDEFLKTAYSTPSNVKNPKNGARKTAKKAA